MVEIINLQIPPTRVFQQLNDFAAELISMQQILSLWYNDHKQILEHGDGYCCRRSVHW